jgi:quercetin dioxygenase-like cupin family protein
MLMIVRGRDAAIEPAEPGVTRQVLGYDSQLMMVRVTFEQGAVGYEHSHPHRQVTYVERGRFAFVLDGTITEMAQGDSWFVPSGVRHGATAIEAGSLIDVFTPARTEFLPR